MQPCENGHGATGETVGQPDPGSGSSPTTHASPACRARSLVRRAGGSHGTRGGDGRRRFLVGDLHLRHRGCRDGTPAAQAGVRRSAWTVCTNGGAPDRRRWREHGRLPLHGPPARSPGRPGHLRPVPDDPRRRERRARPTGSDGVVLEAGRPSPLPRACTSWWTDRPTSSRHGTVRCVTRALRSGLVARPRRLDDARAGPRSAGRTVGLGGSAGSPTTVGPLDLRHRDGHPRHPRARRDPGSAGRGRGCARWSCTSSDTSSGWPTSRTHAS